MTPLTIEQIEEVEDIFRFGFVMAMCNIHVSHRKDKVKGIPQRVKENAFSTGVEEGRKFAFCSRIN